MSNTVSINEKKNRRKGFTFSVAFNTIIVLLALYPFLTFETPDPEPPKFVEVQFTDFKSSSEKSAEGDKKEKEAPQKKVAAEVKEEVVEEPTPEPVVEEVKPEPKPEPTPQRAPVITTTKPNPPVRTSPTKPKKKMRVPPIRNKKPVETKPDPKPKAPAKTKPKKKTNTKAKTKPNSRGKTGAEKQEGKETKSNSGGGEAAENGKDATKGKTDRGTKVGDFPGDGLFNRKVIYRADVKSVTKEEGKIVIDLCVNREGRVVYSKFNKGVSSIKTMSVIRKAMDIAQQYRFEKDYTAPDKQCGKLTFIFEIEEE